MKKISFYAACLLLTTSLIYGSSSCTSKSCSTTPEKTIDPVLAENESDDPLTILKKGNERFVSGKSYQIHTAFDEIKDLVKGQSPKAIIIGCSDSRVAPEILFDQAMGDLFVIRTAGQTMNDNELGSIEYAADHLHTKLIVVLGHHNCGAVNAMLEHAHDEHIPGHIGALVNNLKNQDEQKEVLASSKNPKVDAVIANITHGVKMLRNSEPMLKGMNEKGEIKIVGAVYHLDSGKVEFLEI